MHGVCARIKTMPNTYTKTTPIKQIPLADRPREKLIKYGAQKLTNSELLAILLGSGCQGENVLALSTRILQTIGTDNLVDSSVQSLGKIKGLGQAKACLITASIELGKRLLKEKQHILLIEPQQVYKELKYLSTLKKEHFVVLFLDSRHQVIKKELVAIGTISESLIHPREVFEPAVRNLASQIIVAHNHPSGGLDPSANDISLTKKLTVAGEVLGIAVLDHVIISSKGYFSFKEQNLL